MSNINRFMDIAQFAALVSWLIVWALMLDASWFKWSRQATSWAKKAWAKTAAPVALAKAVKG